MPPLRRRSSLLPFLGISFLLLVLPSAWTRKARLASLAAVTPFKRLACATSDLPGRVLPTGGNEELRTQVDFHKDLIQKQQNEIEILKGSDATAPVFMAVTAESP